MNPAVEQAVADALPHEQKCPAHWTHISGVTRCLCGVNGRRAKLLTRLASATREGYVYLR
jgi:hypothetical protein